MKKSDTETLTVQIVERHPFSLVVQDENGRNYSLISQSPTYNYPGYDIKDNLSLKVSNTKSKIKEFYHMMIKTAILTDESSKETRFVLEVEPSIR